jgi:hypothetical protein
MGRKHSSTSAARVGRSGRAARALDLRKGGLTFREIGERMGFSEQRAHRLVTEELARLNAERAEAAEAVTRLEVERLDALLAAVWPKAKDGNLAAVDRVLAILARRAKMLGIDREKGGGTVLMQQAINTTSARAPMTPEDRVAAVRAILEAAARTTGEHSEAHRLLKMVEAGPDGEAIADGTAPAEAGPVIDAGPPNGDSDGNGHAGSLPYGLKEWAGDDDGPEPLLG